MLGKYCSNLFDDAEVREGLRFVHEEVAKYILRGNETEKIKADIREHSPRRLIDMVKVELDQSLKEGVLLGAPDDGQHSPRQYFASDS